MDDIETYENTDAGASFTTPIQAGSVKKGTIALLKGFPCKVQESKYNKNYIFKFEYLNIRSSKYQPRKLESMVTQKQIS